MKIVVGTAAAVIGLVFLSSFAFANPSMLPKHSGYPASGFANDTGQANAVGDDALASAAKFDDSHSMQNLSINQNNKRGLAKPGAGRLPKVQGPQIKIEPPVKEATRMK